MRQHMQYPNATELVDDILDAPLTRQNEVKTYLNRNIDLICQNPNELLRLLNAKNYLMDQIGVLEILIEKSSGPATDTLLAQFNEIKKTQHWQSLNSFRQNELEKKLLDHKTVNDLLNAKTPEEIKQLIIQSKDKITDTKELKRLLTTAIDNNNKQLLTAINESKMLDSKTLHRSDKIRLQNILSDANAYAMDSQSSNSALTRLKKLNNIDIELEFKKINSLLKAVENNNQQLIGLVKEHYHPENFRSEFDIIGNLSRQDAHYKEKFNELAAKSIASLTLVKLIERANHIIDPESTIKFDISGIPEPNKPHRYNTEMAAINECLDNIPDKSSPNYQILNNIKNVSEQLFNLTRAKNELQILQKSLQKDFGTLDPLKLPIEQRQQLTRMLNAVEINYNEMNNSIREINSLLRNSMPAIDNPSKLRMAQYTQQQNEQDILKNLNDAIIRNDKEATNSIIERVASSDIKLLGTLKNALVTSKVSLANEFMTAGNQQKLEVSSKLQLINTILKNIDQKLLAPTQHTPQTSFSPNTIRRT